jgi:hypothetical protein
MYAQGTLDPQLSATLALCIRRFIGKAKTVYVHQASKSDGSECTSENRVVAVDVQKLNKGLYPQRWQLMYGLQPRSLCRQTIELMRIYTMVAEEVAVDVRLFVSHSIAKLGQLCGPHLFFHHPYFVKKSIALSHLLASMRRDPLLSQHSAVCYDLH